MFVDFNNVFNKKGKNNFELPSTMIQYLNSKLPENLEYKTDEKGICYVIPKKGNLRISGFNYILSDDDKQILGDDPKMNEVFEYFYNAQKPIPLKLLKEGILNINDKEVEIDKIVYNPKNPIKYVEDTLCIVPDKFPAAFRITIGNDLYEKEIKIKRVPNYSVNINTYQALDNEALEIKYSINKLDNRLTMSIGLNIKHAKSIEDIIICAEIYNSLLLGEGTICGQKIYFENLNNNNKYFDKKSIEFFKKIHMIEKALNKNFKASNIDVTFEEMLIAEQVYQNLVLDVPIRKDEKIEYIETEKEEKYNRVDDLNVGDSVFFEYEAILNVELFGKTIKLPTLIHIYNARINSIERHQSKYKIYLDSESENEGRFISYKSFLNNNELQKYKEVTFNKRVNEFKNAKKLIDIVMK